MLVSLAILSVMMACEKGSGSGDEPELDLSPEEAMFLGYWINNASSSSKYYPNIYMSKDGRCYISGERGYEEGYWSYDSETKVLATSVGTWQFNVTLSNEDAWAGTYIYKDQVYNQSFKKASDFETFKLLAREIEPCKSALVVVSFEEDENKNDNVFNYSIESSSMVQTITGKVSMKNSTNLSKTEFTFTGCVEFTSKHSRIFPAYLSLYLDHIPHILLRYCLLRLSCNRCILRYKRSSNVLPDQESCGNISSEHLP